MNVAKGAWLEFVPAVPWALVLCWCDCRNRRLPNWLTLGGWAAVLAWRFGYGGAGSFLNGFAASMAAAAFLFLPFLLRGAGGGDIKMLAAAGAFLGWERVLPLLLYTSFAGLFVAVGMLLAGRLNPARLKHYLRCLFDWRYDRAAGRAALPPAESEQVRVPFSLAIAAGLLAALVMPLIFSRPATPGGLP